MFVLAYFRERVLGSSTEMVSKALTNPDQGLEVDEPTPEQSIAEPPKVQKAAPKKAPPRRKANQTQRKAQQPRESAQSKRSKEREELLRDGAERLKVLHRTVASMCDSHVSASDWILSKDFDNEVAEILPIWTKDCDRHKVRALPIPLEICVRDKLFAGVKHKDNVTFGFIQQVLLEPNVFVRGVPRYRLTFETERARVLFLTHLLDLAFSKYCKSPTISEPEGSPDM